MCATLSLSEEEAVIRVKQKRECLFVSGSTAIDKLT